MTTVLTADQKPERGIIAYRSDIDGLRAIAVLSVIAFHVGVQSLSGGFVGVDIFFVISGYLISGRILSEVENSSFSYADFYLRRVRRIMPAFFVMLAATTTLAGWILYPTDLKAFALALVASVFSVSNIHFWSTQDYFAAGDVNPLLHTWSLSVEEQFYIILPPLLVFCNRFSKAVGRTCLWIVFGASLLVASVTAFNNPTLAFYWPHTRIWEFLIGTALVRAHLTILNKPYLRQMTAAFGILLLAASVLLMHKRLPFPGVTALPACLGTAAIIAAGKSGPTWVGQLLASWPARWIGVLSYSLYLWHWPLIVFLKEAKPAHYLDLSDKSLFGVSLLVISYISWRFVERPFRVTTVRRKQTFLAAAGIATALAVCGMVIVSHDGFPDRFSAKERHLVAFQQHVSPPRARSCFGGFRDEFSAFSTRACLSRDPNRLDVLLVGDSHANHLWHGLSRYSGANIMEITANGCPPLPSSLSSDDPLCRDTARYVFTAIDRYSADVVLLSARWAEANAAELSQALRHFKAIGLRTIVAGPIPEYDAELPKLLAIAERRRDLGLAERHLSRRIQGLDREIQKVARRNGAAYISPYQLLCSNKKGCEQLTPEGAVMQSDYGHLTTEGSDYLARKVFNYSNTTLRDAQ